MIFWFIKPLRLLANTLRDTSSYRRIAYGIAVGMVVGLVPKDNLTAVLLGMIMFSLRINLAAALGSAMLFSWIGVLADPLSNRIGFYLLTASNLQTFWAWLYQQPLMAWTGFHDTTVLGSLILGLWLFYPVYRISKQQIKRLLDRYGEAMTERMARYKVYQFLFGADMASSWRLGG